MTTTVTPTETLIREIYDCFGRADLAGLLARCHADVTFSVPGTAPMSGAWTAATFPAMVGIVMERSAGTFREEILDLMAGESHAAVLLRHTFERTGAPRAYDTIHLWTVRDGKVSAWAEYPRDLHEFEAAWA